MVSHGSSRKFYELEFKKSRKLCKIRFAAILSITFPLFFLDISASIKDFYAATVESLSSQSKIGISIVLEILAINDLLD